MQAYLCAGCRARDAADEDLQTNDHQIEVIYISLYKIVTQLIA